MCPPDPCKGCSLRGCCQLAGLVNRLAVDAYLVDEVYSCPDWAPDYFRGIEGVFA